MSGWEKLDGPGSEEDRMAVGVMSGIPVWRRERLDEFVQPQAMAAQRGQVG